MFEKRSSSLFLYDIYQSVEKIEEFTRGISFDQLMADERTKDAILRNFQVIGEASKNIAESLIAEHPEVDWSGLAGYVILLRTGIFVLTGIYSGPVFTKNYRSSKNSSVP